MPSRPGEFHPEPLTEPDLNLSIHPARAIARRLPPSIAHWAPPVAGWPEAMAMARSLRSTGIAPLHRYYGAVLLLRRTQSIPAHSRNCNVSRILRLIYCLAHSKE